MNKISSFKELMNEITWSWDYPLYDIEKHEDGYSLNKLFISRNRVSYKTESWELAPGVYREFERFYRFLESTNE